MKHFYPVTVAAIGQGVIRGSDGKALTCIGSMPVQVGDTVYTDGNVVYGHSPIKASGAIFKARDILLPFFVQSASWYFFDMYGEGAGYTRNGKLRIHNHIIEENFVITQNWLYTFKNKFYFGDFSIDTQAGVGDYIDVWRTDNVIYTAEFTGDDAPIFGMNCSWNGKKLHDVYSLAMNMYFTESDGLDENGNRTFVQHYSNSGKAYGNPVITIKRNGVETKTFSLGDYQFALDLLKYFYLEYDEPPVEDYPRYHRELTLDGNEYIAALDIWVSYVFTQLLSFSFTGNNGEWEMVLLSMVEGSCSPHTIDDQWMASQQNENVYSYFGFSCPVVYLVVKVRSDGTTTLLQQRININSLEDNGVPFEYESAWENAVNYPVDDVALVEEPYFTLNYGDCTLTTNLRKIGKIMDSHGNTIIDNVNLVTFERLCTSNPNGKGIGALNQFVVYMLGANSSYETEEWSFFGIDSARTYAPVLQNKNNKVTITYGQNAASMFERLSLYKFTNDAWLVCLRNQMLWYVTGGSIEYIGMYPANLNLEMAEIKPQNESLDMPDLIADVTAP